MNLEKAERVLKRTFDMWGRSVNLVTVKKTVSEREMDYALSEDVEPKKSESVIRLRYDGSEYSEHEDVSDIVKEEVIAEDVDYDTVPKSWV
jgi:stage V sporulation protein R